LARLNRIIELLESGASAHLTFASMPLSLDNAPWIAMAGFDGVVFEMEHWGFDFTHLRNSLQALLSRASIIAHGLTPEVTPIARIPALSAENHEWMIKQALDAGLYGLVIPHVESVEQATAILSVCRYPNRRGSKSVAPDGVRGVNPTVAARYWGLSRSEYVDVADLWPVSESGELLIIAMIESAAGVRDLPDILTQCSGIGAIWPGAGDLAASMGLIGQLEHSEVERQVQEVRKVCEAFGVPCVASAPSEEAALRRLEEGFRILVSRDILGYSPLTARGLRPHL
jgi:4-hydroxy-2-oxoheptanedioate aldolase